MLIIHSNSMPVDISILEEILYCTVVVTNRGPLRRCSRNKFLSPQQLFFSLFATANSPLRKEASQDNRTETNSISLQSTSFTILLLSHQSNFLFYLLSPRGSLSSHHRVFTAATLDSFALYGTHSSRHHPPSTAS